MAMAFDGGVAATAAGNICLRATAAERVVGVPRTPNRDATRTTLRRGLRRRRGVASQLELSSDDGGVAEQRRRTGAIGDCGRSRRDKLQGGRGKCDVGLTGHEGFYRRPTSIGILGNFTESGGNLRGCVGTGSSRIHWRHRFAKRTPLRTAQACVVSRLRQRGDKTCERRTRGHVHIQLIKKCL